MTPERPVLDVKPAVDREGQGSEDLAGRCDDRWMKDASDECAMGDDCYCPEGAGSFTEKHQKDDPPGDWDRSKNHYPKLKSLDGTLLPGNVRLMHVHCNRVDYSNLVLEARLLTLTDDDDKSLDDAAVDLAMESHLRLLAENNGRVPKGHKPLKAAVRLAREQNQGLKSGAGHIEEAPFLDRWRARSSDVFRAEARNFRMKGESPRANPSSRALWERYVEWEKPAAIPFDTEQPDAVEYEPAGYSWQSRFEDLQALNKMEGGAVYSARGEGALWIIKDEGTLADFLPQDDSAQEALIRLERYDDQVSWERAVASIVKQARRRFEDADWPAFSTYEEERQRWQGRLDDRRKDS